MMESNALSRQIKELLSQDDIKGAIDLLKANLVDMEALNQVVLKSARYEALQKKEQSGTLDYTTLELEKNRLRESLLLFADNLHAGVQPAHADNIPPVRTSSSAQAARRTNSLPILLGGFAFIIVAAVFLFTKSDSAKVAAAPASPVDTAVVSTAEPVGNGKPLPVVEVSNVLDLLKAIQSNTQVRLKAGTYDLDQISQTWPGSQFVGFVDAGNDARGGATLSNVENLVLTGESGARVITSNFADDVLKLVDCKNIRFENLFFGHPEMNFCQGGVFSINNSRQVKFENCVLHGSGTIGIKATNSELIEMDHSSIEVCSINFLVADGCSKIYFHDSVFEKTNGESGFKIDNTPTLRMERCKIRNNNFSTALFDIGDRCVVSLEDSEVTGSTQAALVARNPFSLHQSGSTNIPR